MAENDGYDDDLPCAEHAFACVDLPGHPATRALIREIEPIGCVATDVQLVAPELAADWAFWHEFGRETTPGHCQHQSLAERLEQDGMWIVSRFVEDLLLSLTARSDRFVWWSQDARLTRDNARGDFISLRAHSDDLSSSYARFAIYEVPRRELEYECDQLGNYDHARGIAGPELALHRVLPQLSLASPMPSCNLRFRVGREPLVALRSVMSSVADLFFEELYNGTRLRLVSRRHSLEQLRAAVDAARAKVPLRIRPDEG